MRVSAALLLAMAHAPPATAQFLFCAPPTKPYRVDGYGAFDRWEFSSCREEVERYRSRTREYLRCLNDEAEEATRQLNTIIDRFNQRASTPR